MKQQEHPVNCSNLFEMIAAGLHPPFSLVNRREFQKTPEERKALKKVKLEHFERIRRAGLNPKKVMNTKEQLKLN